MTTETNFPPGFGREMPTRDGAVYECMERSGDTEIAKWAEYEFKSEGYYAHPDDILCWRLLVPASEVEKAFAEGYALTAFGWKEAERHLVNQGIEHDYANSHARRVAKG